MDARVGARPRRTCLPRLPTTTLSESGGCRHPQFRRLARRRLAVPAPARPRLRGCEGLSALRSLQLCIVERGAGDLERVAEIYQGSQRPEAPALAPRWPGSRHSALCETLFASRASRGRRVGPLRRTRVHARHDTHSELWPDRDGNVTKLTQHARRSPARRGQGTVVRFIQIWKLSRYPISYRIREELLCLRGCAPVCAAAGRCGHILRHVLH